MGLTGSCNQCGLCCVFENKDGDFLRCINLIVMGKMGEPGATMCGVHAIRKDGMSIYMIDQNSQIRQKTVCSMGEVEEQLIIERGIGKGCSYELEE